VLYGFSIAYLFAPTTFDTTHIVEVIQGLPEAVKYTGKTILALPFAYHSLNGVRHLSWDLGKCMSWISFRAAKLTLVQL
jgi:succinate dehydrogenase (ubiquinone) cytochrome b560 subunit